MGVVELLDVAQHTDIILRDKVDSDTLTAETTATTNTMNVVLAVSRHIIVDNKRDLLNINTTRQKIGRDEHTRRARTELAHNHFTLLLVHITVHG